MPVIATKTLQAIDSLLEADQGAKYRGYLGQVMPSMKDAYNTDTFPFRSHLGASVLGKPCDRYIWYHFRWAARQVNKAKMVRLFNRGHIEEARFIALLLSIGVQVYQQDAKGNQFRIYDLGGHIGGSGDGVGVNIPDLPPDVWALLEFKTHGSKSYAKLIKDGVRVAKPEHYTQTNLYMLKMNLTVTLYVAVNKDTDELYAELIYLDKLHAEHYLERGRNIVWLNQPPKKMNNSAAYFECKYCDYVNVCHNGATPDRNCRTCQYSIAKENGSWVCGKTGGIRDKYQQLAACEDYVSSI